MGKFAIPFPRKRQSQGATPWLALAWVMVFALTGCHSMQVAGVGWTSLGASRLNKAKSLFTGTPGILNDQTKDGFAHVGVRVRVSVPLEPAEAPPRPDPSARTAFPRLNSPHFTLGRQFHLLDLPVSWNHGVIVDLYSPTVNTTLSTLTLTKGAFAQVGSGTFQAVGTFPPLRPAIDYQARIYLQDDGGPITTTRLAGSQTQTVTLNAGSNTLSFNISANANANPILTTPVGINFTGDNVPAANAMLFNPAGIARDAAGNIYVADTNNQRIRKIDTSGIITTVAGNGLYGYSGDNGPAIRAKLANPCAVALDGAGNLYIVDNNNEVIRKVDGAGIITTVAGGGGSYNDGVAATATSLNNPSDLAFDAAGNYYIADTWDARIRKVDTSGIITTVCGTGVGGHSANGTLAVNAQIDAPSSVAVDASGTLYIAENGYSPARNYIDKVSAGVFSTYAGVGTAGFNGDGVATAKELNVPVGLAVDAAGNVYFADYTSSMVREVKTNGQMVTLVNVLQNYGILGDGGPATAGYVSAPSDVIVDASGELFIADSNDWRVRKVSTGGIISTIAGTGDVGNGQFGGDGGLATLAQLNVPTNLIADASGTLYIADSGNNVIRKVTPGGVISTVAGQGPPAASGYSGDGGAALSAAMNFPTAVALDAAGNLYVVDQGNNVVRKVTPGGVISTFAGQGPPTSAGYSGDGGAAPSATLNTPNDLAIDATGDLYIADYNNNVVRKVTPGGIISTFAGQGPPVASGYSGDLGAATSATLNGPAGVALDAGGNVYITDSGNNVVRMVSPGGVISTVAASVGNLSNPQGIKADASGNLYIADMWHSQIAKLSTAGTFSAIAGGLGGYNGDGALATNSALNGPTGVAIDNTGNLFIVDQRNNLIREVQQGIPTYSVQPGSSVNGNVVAGNDVVQGDDVTLNTGMANNQPGVSTLNVYLFGPCYAGSSPLSRILLASLTTPASWQTLDWNTNVNAGAYLAANLVGGAGQAVATGEVDVEALDAHNVLVGKASMPIGVFGKPVITVQPQ